MCQNNFRIHFWFDSLYNLHKVWIFIGFVSWFYGWDETNFKIFWTFLSFFLKSKWFYKNKVKTQKIFEKNQWNDFHFVYKNENECGNKVIKNIISNRFIILIQFKNCAWIFLKYFFGLILFWSYIKCENFFEKIQWDDFHFGWKNENEHAKKHQKIQFKINSSI